GRGREPANEGSSGGFRALASRSSEQQGEIDELEARKSSLRAANSAMSSTMWAWREELVKLAAMPSPPITAARLRHIYGEEDLAVPAPKPSGPDAEEEHVPLKIT
uniref:Uncharacterized protein n=1 Tax=Triticum urartu TaxID=4572 RepID=A0A8R7VIZ8_TRIUA